MGLGPVSRGVEGSWGWGLADGAVLYIWFSNLALWLYVCAVCVCCVNDSSIDVCLPSLLYIACVIFYILFLAFRFVFYNFPLVYILLFLILSFVFVFVLSFFIFCNLFLVLFCHLILV